MPSKEKHTQTSASLAYLIGGESPKPCDLHDTMIIFTERKPKKKPQRESAEYSPSAQIPLGTQSAGET